MNKFKNILLRTLKDSNPCAVSVKAGYSHNLIHRWLRDGRVPNVQAYEDVLNVLGYELTLTPIKRNPE